MLPKPPVDCGAGAEVGGLTGAERGQTYAGLASGLLWKEAHRVSGSESPPERVRVGGTPGL